MKRASLLRPFGTVTNCFVQSVSTQGLNRYSYVYNNPLSYVDPSGYFGGFVGKIVGNIFRAGGKVVGNVLELAKSRAGRIMAAVVFAVHGGPSAASFFNVSGNAAAGSFITHFGTTLIASGGDFRAAFSSGIRGAAGAAFGHAGQTFGGRDLAARVLMRSAFGGSGSGPSGGRSGPELSGTASSQPLAPVASGDAAFNTAGGKFANGAVSDAFRNLFRQQTREPGHIYVTGRRVGWIGPIHLAIEYVGASGGSQTLSAGPKDRLLVSEVGREYDRPENNFTIGVISPPSGVSVEQYWEGLKAADKYYCDCVYYDVFPAITGSHNSGGYTSGLIYSTGGFASVDLGDYIGGNDPLPDECFKPQGCPQQ